MATNENLIPIPGRLHSVASEGHVSGADEIYDDTQQKDQETINSELIAAVGTGGSVDSRIAAAINALDSEKSQTAGGDGLALNIVEENGKITSISGSIASNTYDAYGAAANEATRAQNAESALDGRVDTLETAVGSGGSIDTRISNAVVAEATAREAADTVLDGRIDTLEDVVDDCAYIGDNDGSAVIADFDPQTDTVWKKAQTLSAADKAQVKTNLGLPQEIYSKTEVNDLVDTPHQNYVTVATYASLPASGSADTIYRVSNYNGSTSQVDATKYSEYAWDGSDYVFLSVKSQVDEVFDISEYNASAKYADLAAALGTNGANVPEGVRKGGMSVKYVNTDNKYVQYRLTTNTFSTNTKEWQGVCDSFPFLDMDYIAPISNGYHTPTTARVAVPEIYRKYGLVIQYRISSSEIRVEQFIEDSFGYNLNDNCWNTISPNNKKQPFTSLRELIYSGYKVNIETGVSSSDSAYDMTRPISVIQGRTYYCENLILSVAYYGADLNWANSTSRTRCFISGDIVNGHSITVPNNCYYVVINFKRQQLFTYEYVHLIDDKSFINKLTNIDEPLSKTALPVQPFIQLNKACSLSDGSINDNNNYACCILPIKSFTSYLIRCRYNQNSGLKIVLWYSDFPSTDSFMDYIAVTNESQIFNAPQGAKWVGLTFTNRSFDSFHDTCWLEATDVNPCVIRRSGPAFTEYRFNNAPDNSRVSVGMLGTTEANLSYNMDYRTGVHKAYDSTKGAMWLALNGANYAFQYAPENMSTEGDVWENGGKQLALWGNVNQLAACIDSDDAKGTACIFGKRKVQASATFAGFNDCIIEGDRVKGASAPVYINRYNNGKVSIVAGGGNALVGTETDDTVNKLQVNGGIKASQFRLSSLNTAPSSASDTGTAGEIRVTSDYIYVCIATNTWVRSTLESW